MDRASTISSIPTPAFFPPGYLPVAEPKRQQAGRQHTAVEVRAPGVGCGIESTVGQFSGQGKRVSRRLEGQAEAVDRLVAVPQGKKAGSSTTAAMQAARAAQPKRRSSSRAGAVPRRCPRGTRRDIPGTKRPPPYTRYRNSRQTAPPEPTRGAGSAGLQGENRRACRTPAGPPELPAEAGSHRPAT